MTGHPLITNMNYAETRTASLQFWGNSEHDLRLREVSEMEGPCTDYCINIAKETGDLSPNHLSFDRPWRQWIKCLPIWFFFFNVIRRFSEIGMCLRAPHTAQLLWCVFSSSLYFAYSWDLKVVWCIYCYFPSYLILEKEVGSYWLG